MTPMSNQENASLGAPWGGDVSPLDPVTPAETTEQTQVTPVPETAATASTGRRTAPMAMGGKAVREENTPRPVDPVFPSNDEFYEVDANVDYSDISTLNRDINRARRELFRQTRALNDAQAKEAQAKFRYRREHNRILISISGGSEKTRVAAADMETEGLYGEFLVAERVSESALNDLRAIRAELDALAGLSHNIRAQMQVM